MDVVIAAIFDHPVGHGIIIAYFHHVVKNPSTIFGDTTQYDIYIIYNSLTVTIDLKLL